MLIHKCSMPTATQLPMPRQGLPRPQQKLMVLATQIQAAVPYQMMIAKISKTYHQPLLLCKLVCWAMLVRTDQTQAQKQLL